jgi:hypothetical protein
VAEQGFYGCALCVNAKFIDQGSRVNPAVTFIDEGGGFYHFERWLVLIVHGMHGKVALWLCGMGRQKEGDANDERGWRRIDVLWRR